MADKSPPEIGIDDVEPTLEAVVDFLITHMDEESKEAVKVLDKLSLAVLPIGRVIRNEFQLWDRESPLNRHMTDRFGTCHADDHSSIIIDHVWYGIREEPPPADAHYTKYYTNYWKALNINPATQERLK